jgi:predicted dehydrogenase
MHYATHCVAPVLALTRGEAEYVSCFGSGTIREELIKEYDSPYAVETTHIKFRNSDLSAQVYRSLFDVARQYRESFEVYGSKKSVEWPLIEGKPLVVHTAKKPEPEIPEEVESPDFAKLLPKEIQHFTTQGVYDEDEHQHLSFTQGAGHGGSHPHLVHEFVEALVNERAPYPNARQSANITCVGILAHESALKGGEIIRLPGFTLGNVKI